MPHITVYSYTDGSDNNAKASVHLIIPSTVEDNGVTYTVTRIDNNCTEESDGVFATKTNIISAIIPNTVTTIGADAFWSCTGLQEISLGNSVTSIGDNAFQYCASLRSISLPNTLASVGNHFLCHCNKLQSLVIPENLVTIGNYFLHGCESLRNVYLVGNKYRSLGQYPFCSQDEHGDEAVHDCTFWVESELFTSRITRTMAIGKMSMSRIPPLTMLLVTARILIREISMHGQEKTTSLLTRNSIPINQNGRQPAFLQMWM